MMWHQTHLALIKLAIHPQLATFMSSRARDRAYMTGRHELNGASCLNASSQPTNSAPFASTRQAERAWTKLHCEVAR
jgi:hypothetical protein